MLLLPAVLVVYLGFHAGGRFPGAPAVTSVALLAVLAARMVVHRDAFAGFGRRLGAGAVAAAALTAWTVLSQDWSPSPYKALLAGSTTLLYLVLVVGTGSVGFTAARMRLVLLALLAGIAVVVLAGLISRTVPDVFPTHPPLDAARLGFPLDYWNALGLLAGCGLILAFHFAADLTSHRAVRIAAAALAPALATTLLLTLSRGALGAVAIGLVLYVALGHSRGLPGAALAIVPPTMVALVMTYRAVLLTSVSYVTRDGVHEGHVLIVAVVLCAAAAAALRALLHGLDERLLRLRLGPDAVRRIRTRAAIAVGALTAVAIAFSTGTIADQYHRFVNNSPPGGGAIRQRLLTAYNDGRIPVWRAAIKQFEERPLTGTGARTFETIWNRIGTIPLPAPYAHSLYLGVLGDLGLVGAALLLAFLVALVAGLARRVRGPGRTVAAAGLAVLVAWLVDAGVDWDWEMPAVTVAPLAVAALALGTYRAPGRRARRRTWARVAGVAACAALAILPVRIALSQRRLDEAATAYGAGNCPAAVADARASLSALGRPEPLGIVAVCDSRRGLQRPALRAIDGALARDRGSWAWRYERGVILGRLGRDPRPDLRAASAMYPRNPVLGAMVAAAEAAGSPARRRQVSRQLLDVRFAGL